MKQANIFILGCLLLKWLIKCQRFPKCIIISSNVLFGLQPKNIHFTVRGRNKAEHRLESDLFFWKRKTKQPNIWVVTNQWPIALLTTEAWLTITDDMFWLEMNCVQIFNLRHENVNSEKENSGNDKWSDCVLQDLFVLSSTFDLNVDFW